MRWQLPFYVAVICANVWFATGDNTMHAIAGIGWMTLAGLFFCVRRRSNNTAHYLDGPHIASSKEK